MAIHCFNSKKPLMERLIGYFNYLIKAKSSEWQKITNALTKKTLSKHALIIGIMVFSFFITAYACWFILGFFIWGIFLLIASIIIWLEDEKLTGRKGLKIEMLEPMLINPKNEKIKDEKDI